MFGIDTFFYLLILIFSIIAHELGHAAAADALGDNTARRAGRLTINPIPHIDLFGSIILPVLSAFSSLGAIVGWAKPVPYNPYNLRNQRVGETIVAASGVMVNFLIALVFGLIYRVLVAQGVQTSPILDISILIIIVNLSLGLFNLLPLPPFDGLRILTSIFPVALRPIARYMDAYPLPMMLVSLFVAVQIWGAVFPFVGVIGNIIVGQNVF